MKKVLSAMMLMLFLIFVTSTGAVELNMGINDFALQSDTSYPPEDETLPETDEEYPADQDNPDEVDEEPDYTDENDTDLQDEDEETFEEEDN